MCSNYQPVTRVDRLLTFFGVERAKNEPTHDVFPLGTAPFIRLSVEGQEGGKPALIAEDGIFGLLPAFATELAYGRRTYNCRSETVAELASFKHAWTGGQRCIIPAESFYEPNWETGKAVRWRISQPSDIPMGIAGIYRRWKDPAGGHLFTFSMLTVNADDHPVMKRFHKPGDEKRMVVILDPSEYMTWLTCTVDEAPKFFKHWMGALDAVAAPLVRGVKTAPPPKPQDELF